MNLNSIESNIVKKFNYRDLIIFLVPVLIFSVYLFAYNPGILTAASYSQLHQIATGQFTHAYPILYTFIEIVCLKITSSPISIGILQVLVFCLMWMIICKYHRNDAVPDSNEFILQFFLTLIISLIPINAVYSVTLSANVLFSYALMFLCFLIKVLIDRNGEMSKKLAAVMVLTLAAISGLNTFGVYIALILLLGIAAYLFKKGNSQNTLVKFSAITVVCILLIFSLNFIYGVGADSGEFPMEDAFKDGVNLQDARNQFFSSIQDSPTESYENAASVNLQNGKYDSINSYVNLFRENFLLDGLFNNPTLFMILSMLLLCLISFMTRSEEIFLIYAPAILNLAVVVFTGVNNLYSSLLIFYLILIILISILCKLDIKLDDLSKLTQPTVQPKEIKTNVYEVPQFSEPEPYDDYSYIEEELEKLTMDDINEMLGNPQDGETIEIENPSEEPGTTDVPDDDLLDQILKEIENEKK